MWRTDVAIVAATVAMSSSWGTSADLLERGRPILVATRPSDSATAPLRLEPWGSELGADTRMDCSFQRRKEFPSLPIYGQRATRNSTSPRSEQGVIRWPEPRRQSRMVTGDVGSESGRSNHENQCATSSNGEGQQQVKRENGWKGGREGSSEIRTFKKSRQNGRCPQSSLLLLLQATLASGGGFAAAPAGGRAFAPHVGDQSEAALRCCRERGAPDGCGRPPRQRSTYRTGGQEHLAIPIGRM